jgi:hypothetical protein
MNDTARRLRAQKAYSTDPDYLERMAREEETRRVDPANDVATEGGSALAHRTADVIGEMRRGTADYPVRPTLSVNSLSALVNDLRLRR